MFSQTTHYALRAMTFLADLARKNQGNGAAASSELISAEMQVPRSYLSKIMRDLVLAGLVDSQRGPNGGFVLGRSADQITILDVVNAVDPFNRITECPLGKPEHTELCPLHRRLDDAMAQVQCAMRNSTLAELVTTRPAAPTTAKPARRSRAA